MLNIKKIISDKKLDRKAVAKELFPSHKFPMYALNLLESTSDMTGEQYKIFSRLTNIPVGFLIEDKWKVSADQPNKLIFSKGDVKAEVNTSNWLTVIHLYKDGAYQPTYEIQAENVPVKLFLEHLTEVVHTNKVKHLKS